MVRFASAAVALAALSGQALAQIGTNCTQGQFYCGWHLLSGSGAVFDLWKGRIDAALTTRGLPTDGNHEYNTLFWCLSPPNLVVDEFCPATTGRVCQPSTAQYCGLGVTSNDCCGPA